jgi:hypothetical protein
VADVAGARQGSRRNLLLTSLNKQSFRTCCPSRLPDWPYLVYSLSKSIVISMDGKGAWRDNVFVERYHQLREVYLRGYECISDARASIGRATPHLSLEGITFDQAYFTSLPSAIERQ